MVEAAKSVVKYTEGANVATEANAWRTSATPFGLQMLHLWRQALGACASECHDWGLVVIEQKGPASAEQT